MKVAIFLLAVLPFVLSAKVDDKRFIESLLGGYDSKICSEFIYLVQTENYSDKYIESSFTFDSLFY